MKIIKNLIIFVAALITVNWIFQTAYETFSGDEYNYEFTREREIPFTKILKLIGGRNGY